MCVQVHGMGLNFMHSGPGIFDIGPVKADSSTRKHRRKHSAAMAKQNKITYEYMVQNRQPERKNGYQEESILRWRLSLYL